MRTRWLSCGQAVLLGLGLLTPLRAELGHAYDMTVRLDPETKTIQGKADILWTNQGTAATAELWFHLYLNAFKDRNSTFFREGYFPAWWSEEGSIPSENWGSIEITSLVLVNHPERDPIESTTREFVTVGNPDDQTVLRIDLSRAVEVDEAIRVQMEFVSKLPRGIARTGWAHDYFFAGQWFPKLAVYRGERWICYPYHANTEYYSEFADYFVDVEIPSGYVIGGTGLSANISERAGISKYRFRHEKSHDFAWVASPRFVRRGFNYAGARSAAVNVQLLVLREHEDLGNRYLDAIRTALIRYEQWFGPYPYLTLTVVDPPLVSDTQGMEYPSLVTVGTRDWSPSDVPDLEAVTYHEIAHQYWYAAVANNEVEEAWLDEGLATWSEMSLLQEEFPNPPFEKRWLGAIPWMVRNVSGEIHAEGTREMLSEDSLFPITTPSWKVPGKSSYGVLSYTKPYRVLATLEGLVGREAWLGLLRNYYQRFSFRHATTLDFINLTREDLGDEAADFLHSALQSSGRLDYRVGFLRSWPLPGGRFRHEIQLLREGDLDLPVEVLVEFEEGEPLRRRWRPSPGDAVEELELETASPLRRVVIDPDRKVMLDVDRVNNSAWASDLPESQDSRGTYRWGARWLFWLQSLLEVLTFVG